MPKVETSLIQGGKYLDKNNYVSLLVIGTKLNDPKYRQKRNVENDLTKPKRRRKIIKKLVRVQPRENKTEINYKQSNDLDLNTETDPPITTRRPRRRRLRIKKKKKRLLTNTNPSNDYENEEHLQQATKPRRKIVITRKRLLPNTSKYNSTDLSDELIYPSKTTNIVSSTTSKLFHETFVHHFSYDDDDTSVEDSSENLITEDYPSFNTEKYSDFDISTEEINTEENNYEYDDINSSTEDFDFSEEDEENNFVDHSGHEYSDEHFNEDDSDEESFSERHFVEEFPYSKEKEDDVEENITSKNLMESSVDDEYNEQPTFQDIPEYEPSFPELTESFDTPKLLLKTTVLSAVETLTKTTVQSKLRTYTFVITRVSGNEQIITSTTEVKPQIKTITITEPFTTFTTLTLLDFDATQTLTEIQDTKLPALDNTQPQLLNQDQVERSYNEEARYNLATRVMSNGVEVIVAGDKTTLPGEPDVKRLISTHKPVTLKPSTLSDHMVLMLPQENEKAESVSTALYPDQFVTKTCLTTFTYLTTYLEGSTTTVSSHEQVVANVATEERNTGKILPTPAIGITLTQYPNLSVGVFHTTYTYLNTILDGEQPLVMSSKHTVTNTVTAPDDYLSLLKPSETRSTAKDTNTYYSTVGLEKTIYEGNNTQVTSTNEIVTQVVITESVPPRATSVMTSYIALDVEKNPDIDSPYSTTDVEKTYFVTYTYYNTINDNGKQIIQTNISTSSDVVTEKLYLYQKQTNLPFVSVKDDKKKHKIDLTGEKIQILATKSYFTTFTYLTTLLQENNLESPTVISSSTKVIENLVTETIDPNLLDKKYLNIIKSELKDGSSKVVKLATLQNGQKLEITAIPNKILDKIQPTKVLPIEKTKMPEIDTYNKTTSVESSVPSSPNVVTGSTIVFIDQFDDPFAQIVATPTLQTKSDTKLTSNTIKNNLASLLGSEVVENTRISTSVVKTKRPNKRKTKTNGVSPSKTQSQSSTANKQKIHNQETSNKPKPQIDKKKPTSGTKTAVVTPPPQDLLGLGSININSLQALTPVLNAMAGLISTNLKSNRRNDNNTTTKLDNKIDKNVVPVVDVQNRSPIYIPVGGLADDFEIAESQNIATFDWVDPPRKELVPSKTASEASLLNGGIPISPGEIITANSDVIVGKPGRIGPRIPSIPLNQLNTENDIPIGMKPPPAPSNWQKPNYDYKHIPLSNFKNEKHTHTPKKDDYIGPPPPLITKESTVKHIPLSPPNQNVGSFSQNILQIPVIYAQTQNNYDQNIAANELYHEHKYNNVLGSNQNNYNNLQDSIQNNYNNIAENTYPIYAQGHGTPVTPHLVPGTPINEFNIKPSVINEPIVLPEIIERSTGQPLLVNIQPSQVAFVNIPYNRTTALIYGGSTEPHKSGQYFDDPSPYPQPEFSGVENNNGVPPVGSVYRGESFNQKQVTGVIKVGNQLVNIEPVTSENQKVQFNINPSKPIGHNHEISVNVPPISFEFVQQGNDYNAHVINHSELEDRPPANYVVVDGNSNFGRITNSFNTRDQITPQQQNFDTKPFHQQLPSRNDVQYFDQHHQIEQSNVKLGNVDQIRNEVFNEEQYPQLSNMNKRPPVNKNGYSENIPIKPDSSVRDSLQRKPLEIISVTPLKMYQNKPKYTLNRNTVRPIRTEKPNELLEYMTPPPPSSYPSSPSVPYSRRPVHKKPVPIPLAHEFNGLNIRNTSYKRPGVRIPSHNNYFTYNSQQINHDILSDTNEEIGDHREDDLENDDGEVIQESNTRPLLPGEVPFEVLKARNTTQRPIKIIKFPSSGFVKFPSHQVSQEAKPFATSISQNAQTEKNSLIYNNYYQSSTERVNFNTHQTTTERFITTKSQLKNVSNEKTSSPSVHLNYINKHNKEYDRPVTIKQEVTTKRYIDIRGDIKNVFGLKTKQSIETSTVQKPVVIFIDETGKTRESFFHSKKENKQSTQRPTVTSLPIDTASSKPNIVQHHYDSNTQTEKPFVPLVHQESNNEIIIKPLNKDNAITTENTTSYEFGTKIFSILEDTTTLSDMEIMKPPPLVTDSTILKPKPTKFEKKPITDILRVSTPRSEPNKTPNSHIAHRLEEMLPPPQTPKDEIVLGMNPPPLETTYRPLKTTNKPIYSMEIDVPNENIYKGSTTTTTTQRTRYTRPRRPFTRKPTYHSVVSTSSSTTIRTTSTTEKVTSKITPHKHNTSLNNQHLLTTEKTIIPSPTIKVNPSMEIIIGNPNNNLNEIPTTPRDVTTEPTIPSKETTPMEQNPLLDNNKNNHPDLVAVETGSPIINNIIENLTPSENVIITGEHHTGNQVKIVDESTSILSSTPTTKLVQDVKKSTPVLPVRYITHTKTSTITVTKTTVIKTLGLPPSTLTILVTKTEKSTIIDTVTEVRTVVKPTNIVETVTTTIQQISSLYPPEVYGSSYPSIQIKPTHIAPLEEATMIISNINDSDEDDLEDFIINETDPPLPKEREEDINNNDSILVVMTDKNTKNIVKIPNNNHETQERDEMIANHEANNVLLGGILIANNPVTHPEEKRRDKCEPDCNPTRNELCQKIEGLMRCICRPGFARMFPDRPCLPTYTYNLNITLERIGKDGLHYYDDLKNSNSTDFIKFAAATREALDRMVMQSDLRDVFHGVEVHSFEPGPHNLGIISRFYLQLSENIEETKLEDVFRKYLRNNSYSLGGTDIVASYLENLRAEDFDECSDVKFHDCSENAQCFNLKGTYTCSCKEGFSDLSENILYPGRVCSAEQVGCERCNYHGACYSRDGEEVICECFQWYTGESCHINLKVLLIALVTLGALLLILLLICIILTCVRRKPGNIGMMTGMSFLPQRIGNEGTLDRRVMIQDTSSEDSRSETNTSPPVKNLKKPKGALKKTSKVSMQMKGEKCDTTISFPDQKDRSLTVMIPRAKYHPAPPTSPLMNYTTFDARKPSVPSINEAKLISYLDAGPSPNKTEPPRKFSNVPSESYIDEKVNSRKTSGALISAGFEVSATVVNNMGTLGTTCGTEADRSENATLIQKISADLLSTADTRSQFNTLRKSLVDDELVESSSNWLDLIPRVMTVSESRSYDETTIPPPMKSFRNDCDSKPSSQHPNDEANTMAERDLGSTFLLPHTHLYKPDRGSDISGFESL